MLRGQGQMLVCKTCSVLIYPTLLVTCNRGKCLQTLSFWIQYPCSVTPDDENSKAHQPLYHSAFVNISIY